MISGTTILIAHLGYPIDGFKAPMICNPWFERHGLDAVVVPMGVRAGDYAATLKVLFRLTNIRGALVTMPHKVTTVPLLDEVTPAVKIAGACNAILRRDNGTLLGDTFDGTGFVESMARKGEPIAGKRAIVVGNGGAGSAIAAALAAAGVAAIRLFDTFAASSQALGSRLREHYPHVDIVTGSCDPSGCDIVVNATPVGMNDDDPLPIDVSRINSGAFVGDVVRSATMGWSEVR